MKTQTLKGFLLTGFALILVSIGCGGEKQASLSDSIFTSLGIATDSGGSLPTSASLTPYKDTDEPATLPVDFGTTGPQALLNLSSTDQVDRYKSLEIVFSEPMTQSTVTSDFVLKEKVGTLLPGPAAEKGGSFYWKSGGRLIFDPYKELKPNTTYKLTLTSASQGLEGGNLQPYTIEFTTEPDYLIGATLNGTAVGPANSSKDLTYTDAAPGTIAMNLNASFTSPISGANPIQTIKLKHLSSTAEHVICAAPPCDMTAPLASSLNLNTFSGAKAGLKPFQGGNAYIFEITTSNGKVFRRSFGFNYGKVNTTPYALITNGAAAIVDETQALKLFGQILERFTKNDYKIVGKSFSDFSNIPKSTAKRTSYCIDYHSEINFIRSFGDSTDPDNGDGYCGGSGANPGAFVGNGCFLGCSDFDMDVYITGVNIPAMTGADPTITASLSVPANNNLKVSINGRKAIINLAIIARNRSSIGLGLVGSGSKFYFTTIAEVNLNETANPRAAVGNTNTVVDSNGEFNIAIKTPLTIAALPANTASDNFYTKEWSDHLRVKNNAGTLDSVDYVDSTSWAADLLSSVTASIANDMVPALKPAITQSMLKDVVQKVAPNALNAVVTSLANPGLDVILPDYLPAPLQSFPLSLKLKFQTDVVPTVSGANKGLVGSASVALVAKNPLGTSDPNYHGHQLAAGFVSTRPVPNADALTKTFPFSKSSTNPGLLLTLTADTVTQAAYSLWQNGALNLRINKPFIDSITAYAGTDPLFQLTQELVKVGTLLNILAPGRNTLVGLNPSDSSKLIQSVKASDDVDIDVYAIHAPNGEFKFGGANSIPALVVNFTDLELRIYGRRPNGTPIGYPNLNSITCSSAAADSAANSCRYLLNTVRVSIKGDGSFNFIPFVNPDPSGKPQYNNLNAMSLVIKKDENSMAYTLDILEGNSVNPFGLDPKGIFQVVDPLIRSLIIPLVNNVLRQVPLPKSLNVSAITNYSSGAVCNLQSTTDKLKLITIPIPNTEPYPYLFGGLQFQGAAATNPGTVVQCP
ncbi:Ig-like domain-containing protein [Leptospira dzoumogneensis]|uniref:Ig-like protein n=1 Tax=Leptospira dzoumogneensis TaxID=2484904 RepID=A0A4Z1AV87_9LEPT|nr:Ig-like domain-containing protein [Leptospira dzoumogneensis]TGN03989.1 Ig-like protein [Leptospira dzoumogneensis]